MQATPHISTLLLAVICTSLCRADEIHFEDADTRLSGEILSLSSDGKVQLTSSLSTTPLHIAAAAVQRILFSSKAPATKPSPARIVLQNGDTLPATNPGIQDGVLTATSPFLGQISLPTKSISTVQLGISSPKTYYHGPETVREWADNAQANNWKYKNTRRLTTTTFAKASKQFDLPDLYQIDFTLYWHSAPNMQVFFADPLDDPSRTDRYLLQVTRNSVELKRQCKDGRTYRPMRQITTPFSARGNQKLDFTLVVNRRDARVTISIDGQTIGSYLDPTDKAPTGSGMSLVFSSSDNLEQEIRNIHIAEYQPTHPHDTDDYKHKRKKDGLITNDDEHIEGTIHSMNSQFINFTSDFQKSPLKIASSQITTLYFSSPKKNDKKHSAEPSLVLSLHGGSMLSIDSCEIKEDTITFHHPDLGQLTIPRNSASALVKPDTEEP